MIAKSMCSISDNLLRDYLIALNPHMVFHQQLHEFHQFQQSPSCLPAIQFNVLMIRLHLNCDCFVVYRYQNGNILLLLYACCDQYEVFWVGQHIDLQALHCQIRSWGIVHCYGVVEAIFVLGLNAS